jgi:hypothetical protein
MGQAHGRDKSGPYPYPVFIVKERVSRPLLIGPGHQPYPVFIVKEHVSRPLLIDPGHQPYPIFIG